MHKLSNAFGHFAAQIILLGWAVDMTIPFLLCAETNKYSLFLIF